MTVSELLTDKIHLVIYLYKNLSDEDVPVSMSVYHNHRLIPITNPKYNDTTVCENYKITGEEKDVLYVYVKDVIGPHPVK